LIDPETQEEQLQVRTFFVYRNNWFVLAQTEGAEFQLSIPGFDIDKALQVLDIERIGFDMIDGNIQGYARGQINCDKSCRAATKQDYVP
jgi:hypothetical protein